MEPNMGRGNDPRMDAVTLKTSIWERKVFLGSYEELPLYWSSNSKVDILIRTSTPLYENRPRFCSLRNQFRRWTIENVRLDYKIHRESLFRCLNCLCTPSSSRTKQQSLQSPFSQTCFFQQLVLSSPWGLKDSGDELLKTSDSTVKFIGDSLNLTKISVPLG